jgi:hypothetical protein
MGLFFISNYSCFSLYNPLFHPLAILATIDGPVLSSMAILAMGVQMELVMCASVIYGLSDVGTFLISHQVTAATRITIIPVASLTNAFSVLGPMRLMKKSALMGCLGSGLLGSLKLVL